MSVLLAVIIFGVLIFFHEFGHFLLAKKNGIVVTEFSLGMGPRLLSKQVGETRYSLKALPFGGSCAMLGEDEDSASEGAFGSKKVWQRILVVAAGPFFNFLMGLFLSLIVVTAFGYDEPVIGEVIEGYPAEAAGLEAGDEIREINGTSIRMWRDISLYNLLSEGEEATVVYRRGGETQTTQLKPQYDEDLGYYLIGIRSGGEVSKVKNPLEALKYGFYECRYWLRSVVESLKMLLTGRAGLQDMSGVVGVYGVIDDTYQAASGVSVAAVVASMLNITILLTMSLGIMNLLPLPALDGGRLVFLILEGIRGKRIDPEIEGRIHFAGLVLLLLFSVYIMFNDFRYHL